MKNNKKGFTLAELLVVVAIIGILVAVSIPIFTSQLQKARLATNQANARAAKAAAVAAYLQDDAITGGTYTTADGKFVSGTVTAGFSTDMSITGWKTSTVIGSITLGNDVANTWYVTVSDAGVTGFGAEKK